MNAPPRFVCARCLSVVPGYSASASTGVGFWRGLVGVTFLAAGLMGLIADHRTSILVVAAAVLLCIDPRRAQWHCDCCHAAELVPLNSPRGRVLAEESARIGH
jgi:hypothetical protein